MVEKWLIRNDPSNCQVAISQISAHSRYPKDLGLGLERSQRGVRYCRRATIRAYEGRREKQIRRTDDDQMRNDIPEKVARDDSFARYILFRSITINARTKRLTDDRQTFGPTNGWGRDK